MSKLICVKFTVGGNYNSTYDNNETVYFLTAINENDLLNVTENNSENLPMNSAAIESAIPTGDALSNNNIQEEEPAEIIEEEEPVEEEEPAEVIEEEPKKQSNVGAYLIMGILAAGAIGAWYYLKIVKGKKEDFIDEEDEEDEDDEEYESDDDGDNTDSDDDFFNDPDSVDDVADTIDDED